MKILRLAIPVLAGLTVLSCSESELVENLRPAGSGVKAVVENPVSGELQVKALDEGFVFSFEENDHINVYGNSDRECMVYSISSSGEESGSAQFNVEYFDIKDGTYYAVYPSLDAKSAPSGIPLTFSGQKQAENNSAAHLATFDYNRAEAEISSNSGVFLFKHKVSWLKVSVPVANVTKFTSVTVSSDEGVAASASLNAITGEVSTERSHGDVLTLSLGESGIDVDADGTFTAFITVPSEEYTNLTVTVSSDKGTGVFVKDGATTLEAGKYYPVSVDMDNHTTIAALCSMAGASGKSFDVVLKNAVVTCVSGKYAHIQDGTAAVMVFASGHGLSVGDCINGPVSGQIVLYNGGASVSDGSLAYAEITSIDCSDAVVSHVSELPVTNATIAEVNADIANYYNQRVLLKNVLVTTGISSSVQSGYVSQDGESVMIFNKNKSAEIGTGLTGDLICYPLIYRGTIELIVYTSDQFTEKEIGGEDTPFTHISALGWYSSTDTDAPVPALRYNEGYDQISCGSGSSSRTFKIFNVENNTLNTLTIQTSFLTIGGVFDAYENLGSGERARTFTVVNKSGKTVWLEDKTAHTGCIIEIE